MNVLQRLWGMMGAPKEWTRIADLNTPEEIASGRRMVEADPENYRLVDGEDK